MEMKDIEVVLSSLGQTLLTHLQRAFECSPPKNFHIARQPGDYVSGHVRAAVGHGLYLCWLQNTVPNVHLTQLAHECLSGIESAAHHVLEGP